MRASRLYFTLLTLKVESPSQDRATITPKIGNFGTTGYPNLDLDAFKPPRDIEEYNHRFKVAEPHPDLIPDAPAYSHVSAFFDGVVEALKVMKKHIKIELLCGELIQEMSKMRFCGDESRPADFPRSFTRAWLSNVP